MLESKIKSLTVEDVNNAIKKHFKTYENWTVVNAGDFTNLINLDQEKTKD